MTDEELIEDAEAIAGLVWNGAAPVPVARSLEYTFTFPAQQHHFDAGDHGFEPTEDQRSWTVAAVDNALGTITLRRGKARVDEPLGGGTAVLLQVAHPLVAGDEHQLDALDLTRAEMRRGHQRQLVERQ